MCHWLLDKTHWQRRREELQVSFIHRIKVCHRGDEDIDLDDVLQLRASCFKNMFQICQRLDCPLSDATFDKLLGGWIDAYIARAVDHTIV